MAMADSARTGRVTDTALDAITAGPRWPQLFAATSHGVTGSGQPITLAGGHCASCERASFPLQSHCPWCGAEGVPAIDLPDTGVVVAASLISFDTPGSLLPAPYWACLVRLNGVGLDIMAVASAEPDASIEPGRHVHIVTGWLSSGQLHFLAAPALEAL
jgi:uncharacterized OB-fold protein